MNVDEQIRTAVILKIREGAQTAEPSYEHPWIPEPMPTAAGVSEGQGQ